MVGQKIAFTPNTAAINARYNSAKNPLLIWKYAYPLTPEEIVRREDRKKEEEKIVNQVLKTIFSKKKNINPVSPAFLRAKPAYDRFNLMPFSI